MYNAGLVLEGGGMRGIFSAGVLDFFLENNISFAQIIGVSAGACHACSYLSGQRGRAKAISVDYLDNKLYCSAYSLITSGDLFGKKFVYETIPNQLNLFDYDAYLANPTRLFAAVTNIETGQAEYIELKDLKEDMEALRASASLPLVSRIVNVNGKKYLDGGVADSIPIREMQARGFEKTVVVLTQPKGYVKEANPGGWLTKAMYRKYPALITSMKERHKAYNATLTYIDEQEAMGKVFVIRPTEKLVIERIEKDRAKLEAVYNLGYLQAKSRHEEMVKFLGGE